MRTLGRRGQNTLFPQHLPARQMQEFLRQCFLNNAWIRHFTLFDIFLNSPECSYFMLDFHLRHGYNRRNMFAREGVTVKRIIDDRLATEKETEKMDDFSSYT